MPPSIWTSTSSPAVAPSLHTATSTSASSWWPRTPARFGTIPKRRSAPRWFTFAQALEQADSAELRRLFTKAHELSVVGQ
jgi:hypothetical protein